MRKLIATAILLLCCSSAILAQRSAYYDALYLKTYCDKKGKFKLEPANKALIDAYFHIGGLSQPQIDTLILRNPFLAPYYQPTGGAQGMLGMSIPGAISGLGNMDVTTIADGLAKFLVQRTKEELSVAFFAQLKQDMANEKYAPLRTLFPQTYSVLQTIDQNIYQFSVYLTDLRTAFTADLDNIPTTLPYIATLPGYEEYFNTHPWIQRTIQTGFFVAGFLTAYGKNDSLFHAGNLISEINANLLFPLSSKSATDTNINGAIKTLQIFSASFHDTAKGHYWVPGKDILKLVQDSTALNLYLGLIYQEAISDTVLYAGGHSLKGALDVIAAHHTYADIRQDITAFTMQLNLFDANWKTLKAIKAGDIKDSAYVYYSALFNNGVNIITDGLSLAKDVCNDAGISTDQAFWTNTDHYIAALHDVSNVYLYINQKKYAMAVSSLTGFFTNISQDNSKLGNISRVVQKLNTYGTFMAQVANAKTSDEVDSIITSTVLPVGSSYIKKHAAFNIALNGYTGLYGGVQRQATDEKFVGVGGVYAPIGVAASWGLGTKNPSAISLFISIIDLGPLVSFRFSNYNDTLANDVKIRLNQILSPGVHAVWGLPKVPLSLGGGVNWTPLLTGVEKDKIATMPDNKMPLRVELFLAVDIPLLNFYNKPK